MYNIGLFLLLIHVFLPHHQAMERQTVSLFPATVYALSAGCDSAFIAEEFACRHGKALVLSAQKLDPVLGQNLGSLTSANHQISNRHAEEIRRWSASFRQSFQSARREMARVYGNRLNFVIPLLQMAANDFKNGEFFFRKGRELKDAFDQVSPDLGLALTDMVDNSGRISDKFSFAIISLLDVLGQLTSAHSPPPSDSKRILTVQEGRFLLQLIRNNEIDEAEAFLIQALKR
jgi:hypothetical protein